MSQRWLPSIIVARRYNAGGREVKRCWGSWPHHLGRAHHCLRRQLQRNVARQASRNTAVRQRLNRQEHVTGTAYHKGRCQGLLNAPMPTSNTAELPDRGTDSPVLHDHNTAEMAFSEGMTDAWRAALTLGRCR